MNRSMILRTLRIGLFLLLAQTAFSAANAGGWTVYIKHTCQNTGWIRTGFAHDLYTDEATCRRSVSDRVNENRRYGTDNEHFAIVYHNSSPPSGALRNFVRGYIAYSQGRCTSQRSCVYYAVIRYNGREGYLGSYATAAIAETQGRNWVRAVPGSVYLRTYQHCQ
ncbi:MAG: hypothetical protein R3C05_26145 [Pirellulaceae bacterium]